MTVAITDLDPGTETQVNTYSTDGQFVSQIAALSGGGFVIVWESFGQDGSDSGVFAQIYDASGVAVGAEFQVNTTSTDAQWAPTVAGLADGGFVVTWTSEDQDNFGIYAQAYDATGTASGGEVAINTESTASQDYSTVAGLADGGYVIAWESADQDGDGYGIYLQQYDADGTAVGSETQVNTTTTGDQSYPVIAALSDGGYVIAWAGQDTASGGILLQRFDWDGTAVGSETVVNTTEAGLQDDPSIAALSDGGYIVAWTSDGQDGSSYGVYAQRFDSNDTPVGSEFQINTTTTDTQFDAQVTGLSDGGYVFTWSSELQDGSGYGIYSQRYDANDNPVGTETLVNTYTASDQLFTSVQATADGGYTVTWTSDLQDGSGSGVYMKSWSVADTFGTSAGEVMDGTGAAVHMLGGDGDDTYIVDSADDTVTELPNEGHDLIISSVSWTIDANVEDIVLTGTDDIDAGGNDLDNAMSGNSGDNILDGDVGADTMAGGDGDDTYVIDDVDDVIIELDGEGQDEIEIGWTYTLTEGGYFEDLHLTGTGDIDGTGNSDDNVIIGNAGANVLTGLDGDDSIDGGLGDDLMIGGDGNDFYMVDSTNDVIVEDFNRGLDIVYTTASYTLSANVDGLLVYDPESTDNLNLTGNGLNNIISGNDGNNIINGAGGVDIMYGFGGDDVYYVNSFFDEVSEELICGCDAGGTDKVISSDDFYLPDYVENLTLTGTADLMGIGNDKDNILRGNSGDNILDGDEGNDKIDGGAGADEMYGGADDDTYYVDDNGDQTIEDYTPGVDDGGTDLVIAAISWTLNDYIENLNLAGTGNIDGTGNGENNTLRGNSGNNKLTGATGSDTMYGGAGDDTYYADRLDRIIETSSSGGTDTVVGAFNIKLGDNVENLVLTGTDMYYGVGNGLDNELTGNVMANKLDGGIGADTMSGGAGSDTYYVDDLDDVVSEESTPGSDDGGTADGVIATVSFTLGAYIETLKLTGTDDIDGTGNGLANTLFGNSGDNVLDGGAGADTLSGGTGDDTYYVDDAGDKVQELPSSGQDLVHASVNYALRGQIEDLILDGTDNLNGTGNELNNVLTGNSGNNKLDGKAGDDSMYGGAGNDTYYVDSTSDVTSESPLGTDDGGTDRVMSSVTFGLADYIEDLNLTGTGDIDGTGNGLANMIRGNSGANALRGGAGNDGLIGNGGADYFQFEAAGAANGKDRVYDFAHGVDVLAFTGSDYGFSASHSLASDELTIGTKAVGSSAQFVFNGATSTLYWDADGAGNGAAVAIALLSGVTTLDASDFLFV